MAFHPRPFQGPADFPQISELVARVPASDLSVSALPYQLSSWACDRLENVGLWSDTGGALVAFALLQVPFASLYYAIAPGLAPALEERLLAWACRRGQAIADSQGQPLSLAAWPAADRTDSMARLVHQGFAPVAESKVFFSRSLADPLPPPELPADFRLDHLQAPEEMPAAAALLSAAFGIQTVTEAWRRRLLAQPAYQPELDLLVRAPDERLAAFCLCWQHPAGHTGQIEPMGTHPEFQRRGLGRAALLGGLRALRARGVREALVGTSTANRASQALYGSVGFQVHHTKVGHRCTFLPGG